MDCCWTEILVAVAVGVVGLFLLRKFIKGGVCHSNARLDGKTVVITGCNTGIGKETVRDMARRGARVVMACRSVDKANEAARDVKTDLGKADIAVYRFVLILFCRILGDCPQLILLFQV